MIYRLRPFIKALFPSAKLRFSISHFNMALLARYLKTRRNEIEMRGNRKYFRDLTVGPYLMVRHPTHKSKRKPLPNFAAFYCEVPGSVIASFEDSSPWQI